MLLRSPPSAALASTTAHWRAAHPCSSATRATAPSKVCLCGRLAPRAKGASSEHAPQPRRRRRMADQSRASSLSFSNCRPQLVAASAGSGAGTADTPGTRSTGSSRTARWSRVLGGWDGHASAQVSWNRPCCELCGVANALFGSLASVRVTAHCPMASLLTLAQCLTLAVLLAAIRNGWSFEPA